MMCLSSRSCPPLWCQSCALSLPWSLWHWVLPTTCTHGTSYALRLRTSTLMSLWTTSLSRRLLIASAVPSCRRSWVLVLRTREVDRTCRQAQPLAFVIRSPVAGRNYTWPLRSSSGNFQGSSSLSWL
uniref:Putative secreted protein n=1 Tax=Amblyomma tuberculatum TaxID=48802 RepID=A0A6M2E5E4_9ACAR